MKREHTCEFLRIKRGNSIFYGMEYKKSKTRNSCTVVFCDGSEESYGTIINFVKFANKVFALIQKCETVPFTLNATTKRALQGTDLEGYLSKTICPHMVEVKQKFGVQKLVNFHHVIQKCVLLDIKQGHTLISKPPNLLEHG